MKSTTDRTKDIIWYHCNVNRIEKAAHGMIIGHQFLVSSGSKVSELRASASLKRNSVAYKLRQKLEKDGIIDKGCFTTEYVFDNPSVALKIIRATSQGNLNEWMDDEGRTIKHRWNSTKTEVMKP